MEDKGIDFQNYESVCVDHPYGAGNLVKVDLTGGGVDIDQTQTGEFRISLRMRLREHGGICYRFVWRSK